MDISNLIANESIKGAIIELLSERSYGLTIEEISRLLNINRTTASKYLFVLNAEGKIFVRDVGKAKLHYLKRYFEVEK